MSSEAHGTKAKNFSVDGIRQKPSFDMTGSKVAVIGLNQNGFSLAGLSASQGFETIGYDPDEVKVAQLDDYSSTNKRSARNLSITSDATRLRACDLFIICSSGADAGDISQLEVAATEVGANLHEGGLVILESIVFPGVCEQALMPLLEKASGLARPTPERSRGDFFFAHAPALRRGGRRAIGAANSEGLARARAFYHSLDIETIAMHTIKEAEAVTMVEDSLHDVALALSNEFSILFDRIGVDIANVSKAVSIEASVFSGIGSPRSSPSAYFLSRSGHEHETDQQFLATARRVVEYMPTYVVNALSEALQERRIELKNAAIALLGISNGREIGDKGVGARIRDALTKKGVTARIYDPHVAGAGFDLKETLEGADAAIVAGNHPMFRSLSPRQFEELGVTIVIDARNALDKGAFEKSPVAYRGIGRG